MGHQPDQFRGVALITGAGGTGIGAATAQAFVTAGCRRIAITDINPATLATTKSNLLVTAADVDVLAITGDISDEAFVHELITSVVTKYGRIDYAVNCAGTLNSTSVKSTDMTVAAFDRITSINYRGCWMSSRQELAAMVKQLPLSPEHQHRGAIVNVASQLGIVARPGAAAYCASKAAIINMTRADAIDFAPDVRINCICPGMVLTPMLNSDPGLQGNVEKMAKKTPVGRLGRPEEIAEAILFLCSPGASFIQGHALVVDGGYTIQ